MLKDLFRAALLATLLVAVSCGPGTSDLGAGGGTSTGGGTGSAVGGGSGGGGTGNAAGGGSGGGSANGTGGGGGGGTSYSADSFFSQCNGVATTLTGTALAPNGTDPVSKAEISVWDHLPVAFPSGVVCETCTGLPTDLPLSSTEAAADGKFTLNLDSVKKQGTYYVTVRKARFRKVLSSVNINACGTAALTPAQASLPKSVAEGDVPKIAISSGNRDHLEKVIKAMGFTDYDCFKGLPAGSTADTCTANRTLGSLLGDLNQLKGYGLLFISCAVADTYGPQSGNDPIAKNLKAWVEMGGKLVVTDESYDFVEQAFPDAIDFQGPSAMPGVPQPVNGAEIGTSVASVTGVISDPSLAAWLRLFPSTITDTNQVALQGFLSKWAVQKAPGPNTVAILHGMAPFAGGTTDVPLTSGFEVKGCGRVIYSSYHTDSGGAQLLPQERILEYLMFEVALCTSIIN